MSINLPILTKFDNRGINEAESSLKNFGKAAGAIAAAATVAVAGIAVVSIKAFADFDSKLQQSLAIMGDVSDSLQNEMSDAARLVAKTTTFSADEAAESFYFLASAGLDATESIAALPQVAAFAQAGMFDMATATDIVTDAQAALGLTSDDAAQNLENLTRVTDVFVKAATLGNTSVEQLGSAMTSKAAKALTDLGKSVEEGAAALTVFAGQGIKGERAGTLLTNTLDGLVTQSQKSPEAFKALGVAVFDADGDMRNMADIVGDLENGLEGMSTESQQAALSQLGFGKQTKEGISALLGQSEALREFEEALMDAGGTTAEVAAKQLETATAQFGILKSVVTDLGIEIGSALTPALGNIAGAMAPLIDSFLPAISDFMQNKVKPAFDNAAASFKLFSDQVVQNGFGQALQDQVQVVADKFKTFFTGQGLQDALMGFLKFRSELTHKMLDALPGILDGFVKVLPLIIAFIANEFIPMIVEQFIDISTELVRILSRALPMIIEAIADTIPGILAALAAMLPVIIAQLLTFIPEVLTAALNIFTALIEAIQTIIPDLITAVIELLPQLIETILGMLPEFITSALELFNGLLTALIETIPILLSAIIAALPEILVTIIGMLPELLKAAIELFMGLVTAVVDILPELLVAIVTLLPEITAAVVGMIPDLIVAGIDLFLALVTALIDATPEILTAIIELIPEITGALISAMPQMIAAGFDLLKGLAKGIYENLPQIASNIASSIGSSITNAVKGFFGIESPSKLFAEIGGDLAAGLEQGIEGSTDLAVGASLNMATKVKFATDSAFDSVSSNAMSTPSFSSSNGQKKVSSNNFNVTVNAGLGADGQRIGQVIVDEIKKFERSNGPVFAGA